MKKIFIGIIAAAAMVGCVKRDAIAPTSGAGSLGTATIAGKVMINTDFSNDTTNWETDIPLALKTVWDNKASVRVTLTYSSGHLDETNTTSGETRTITTMTDATTGAYSFAVKTPINGDIRYDISFERSVMLDATIAVDSSIGGGGKAGTVVVPLTFDPYTSVNAVYVDVTGSDRVYKNPCGDSYKLNSTSSGHSVYVTRTSTDFWEFTFLTSNFCEGNPDEGYTVKNGDVKTLKDVYYTNIDNHEKAFNGKSLTTSTL